jgi:hypothetical protein
VVGRAGFPAPYARGGQNLIASGYGARSGDAGGGEGAWGLSLDYPNDWSDSYLGVSHVGRGFDGMWAASSSFPAPLSWGFGG